MDGRPGHAVVRDDRGGLARPHGRLDEAFTIATDDCDGVFLSVDVDVCDPAHAPGTGTPEPGGITARELLDAVRRTCRELPVVGVDVVEVSPPYDHADITAALANRVVLEALSGMAARRTPPATTRPDRRSRGSPSPRRRRGWIGLHLVGRAMCPPPDWWVRLFVPSGDFGASSDSTSS